MEKVPPLIAEKIAFLPDQPGVYIWKNAHGEVIYVGKALALKHRIRSYLTGMHDLKTDQLVKHIADLDYIITNNENEAFLLEATLIKRHRPKYNINLKDDKRYPFVRVTVQEPFPRIMVTRDLVKDGSRYFGPFTDTRALRSTLRDLEWIFPLRDCKRIIPADEIRYSRACINYQLGKCPAPCIGKIDVEGYGAIVKGLLAFFSGKYQEVADDLRQEMQALSDAMKFEQAAAIRDKLLAIERIQKRQTVYYMDERSADIIGCYLEENLAVCVVLRMQSGAIINSESYPMTNVEHSDEAQVLAAFLKLYYADHEELPQEIMLPQQPQDYEELNEWLQKRLVLPQRGERSRLLAMAKRNAFHLVEERKLAHLRKANRTIYPIQELKEKLNLSRLPRKMVCMDISTIQGSDTVSSAVFFENGKPKKKQYRHFIIRSIDKQDDFAALQETLQRYLDEIAKDPDMKPDLFVIDGGKGQLNACVKILAENEYADIPIISLAKRAEEVFIPDAADSVILPRSSAALRLLIALRDEAHRFAINFHRSRRSKRTLFSELEDIPGVGKHLKFLLLKELGSVEQIAKAPIEELTSIKGIGIKTAKTVYDYFHPQQNNDNKS
ncbi:MAG: excinuclease ABC subunit UvrC [Candidatus Cloacimonetes bacterium]|nr:excinuclease ABC subunit UvrC [Candidatus Cloacimonadota bacterium]